MATCRNQIRAKGTSPPSPPPIQSGFQAKGLAWSKEERKGWQTTRSIELVWWPTALLNSPREPYRPRWGSRSRMQRERLELPTTV